MVRRLRAALALGRAEWWLLARAWARLWRIAIGLRRGVPLPALRRRLARHRPAAAPGGDLTPAAVARLVTAAARLHPVPGACLERSLCLESLLAERGFQAVLRVGARRDGGSIAAHSWVEVDGRPVGEPAGVAERFPPLDGARRGI